MFVINITGDSFIFNFLDKFKSFDLLIKKCFLDIMDISIFTSLNTIKFLYLKYILSFLLFLNSNLHPSKYSLSSSVNLKLVSSDKKQNGKLSNLSIIISLKSNSIIYVDPGIGSFGNSNVM